jgi:hypothetical protein
MFQEPMEMAVGMLFGHNLQPNTFYEYSLTFLET